MRGRALFPCVGLLASAAFAAAHATPAPLVLVNLTHSLPLGAWRLSSRSPGLGDVVALRPPEKARGYLDGLGYPSTALLLKRVSQIGEGTACARPGALQVEDWTIPRRSHDRRGAPIPTWSECRRLASDELIVLGQSADSFDSRYFGPIRAGQVVGVYERLPWPWP